MTKNPFLHRPPVLPLHAFAPTRITSPPTTTTSQVLSRVFPPQIRTILTVSIHTPGPTQPTARLSLTTITSLSRPLHSKTSPAQHPPTAPPPALNPLPLPTRPHTVCSTSPPSTPPPPLSPPSTPLRPPLPTALLPPPPSASPLLPTSLYMTRSPHTCMTAAASPLRVTASRRRWRSGSRRSLIRIKWRRWRCMLRVGFSAFMHFGFLPLSWHADGFCFCLQHSVFRMTHYPCTTGAIPGAGSSASGCFSTRSPCTSDALTHASAARRFRTTALTVYSRPSFFSSRLFLSVSLSTQVPIIPSQIPHLSTPVFSLTPITHNNKNNTKTRTPCVPDPAHPFIIYPPVSKCTTRHPHNKTLQPAQPASACTFLLSPSHSISQRRERVTAASRPNVFTFHMFLLLPRFRFPVPVPCLFLLPPHPLLPFFPFFPLPPPSPFPAIRSCSFHFIQFGSLSTPTRTPSFPLIDVTSFPSPPSPPFISRLGRTRRALLDTDLSLSLSLSLSLYLSCSYMKQYVRTTMAVPSHAIQSHQKKNICTFGIH